MKSGTITKHCQSVQLWSYDLRSANSLTEYNGEYIKLTSSYPCSSRIAEIAAVAASSCDKNVTVSKKLKKKKQKKNRSRSHLITKAEGTDLQQRKIKVKNALNALKVIVTCSSLFLLLLLLFFLLISGRTGYCDAMMMKLLCGRGSFVFVKYLLWSPLMT